MDLGIAGKVAFVAGGSKGMGRACAELLAAEGCSVAVVARSQDSIDEVVDAIQAKGGNAIGVSADLTSRDSVNDAVATVTAKLGSPDIVVGQTNDMTLGFFDDVTDEDFERVFRVFTMAQVYLARATLPAMRKRKWGRYIHIGSYCAKEPEYSHPHTVANTIRPSTGALLRVLANEVAADGVTINVIGPGYIWTPTLQSFITNNMQVTAEEGRGWVAGIMPPGMEAKGIVAAGVPMKRPGTPEEIGGIVTFLASNYAGYVTGEWIAVDGGKHSFSY